MRSVQLLITNASLNLKVLHISSTSVDAFPWMGHQFRIYPSDSISIPSKRVRYQITVKVLLQTESYKNLLSF